jgi:hypothetical protein
MHHSNIALPHVEAHVADPYWSTHRSSIAPPRRRLRALALGLGAIALLAPTSVFAQPPHDLAAPAHAHGDAVHRHHSRVATHPSITFTNPLGRSRGPGAGAGLL